MKLINVFRKTKPLFLTTNNEMVVAKNNKIFISTLNGKCKFLFSFEESFFNKIFSYFSLLFRMKRLGVMSSIGVMNDYFFSYGKKIYRYNCLTKKKIVEYSFDKGRGPLQFCYVVDVDGFDNCVCFGEYYGNHSRMPVAIIKRNTNGIWNKIYEFKNGEINHIHALIPDKYNKCVWILAGDFEHSAAIYKASDNFKSIELILEGEQKYRSCVAFPTKDGLIYATDTQLETNTIRLLINKENVWVSEKLFDLNGSCIYGCEIKDYFIFSTSTEPKDNPSNTLIGLLDNKPGPGILENKSDIVSYCKKSKKCKVLISKKKDLYPYRLFQFGTIMFPSGPNSKNLLIAYNVGSKENDLSTEIYQL